MNWESLVSLFSGEELGPVFGAVFAFLYLLSGSAVGFLVSQLWYVFFNWHFFGKYYDHEEINRVLKCKLKPTERVDFHRLHVFSDYIQRLSKSKEMLIYAQRRWDLIHIFGSAIFAIASGFLVGIVYYLINTENQFATLGAALKIHWMLILLIVISTGLILVCLGKGLFRTLKEHSIARLILIQEVLDENEKKDLLIRLKRSFPKYFQASEEKEKKSPNQH